MKMTQSTDPLELELEAPAERSDCRTEKRLLHPLQIAGRFGKFGYVIFAMYLDIMFI